MHHIYLKHNCVQIHVHNSSVILRLYKHPNLITSAKCLNIIYIVLSLVMINFIANIFVMSFSVYQLNRSSCAERLSSDSVLFCFQQHLQSYWIIRNPSYYCKEGYQVCAFFCSFEYLMYGSAFQLFILQFIFGARYPLSAQLDWCLGFFILFLIKKILIN